MFTSQKLTIVAILAAAGSAARAQVSLSVDRLDGSDPGAPAPPGLVVVDLFADVAATDVWTATGLRALASHGAVLAYGAGSELLNPSLPDPFMIDPFVTCVSKPLARDAQARFFNAGAAISGRYDPSGPAATATASEVNVTWFSSPPATATSPSVDGYIARLAIDVSGVAGIDPATITVSTGLPPPGSVPLVVSRPSSAPFGTAAATLDVPALSGFQWNVHAFGPAAADPTVFRYSFADGTLLPAVPDQGPSRNDATAGPAAVLSPDIPPNGPASGGNRSLDCHSGGAVTDNTQLLMNDLLAFGGGFTMEAWFKWNGGGRVNSIIDYAGTEKLVIDVRSGGTPTVAMRFNDSTSFAIGPVVPGIWYYVAVVFQSTTQNADGTVTGTFTTYLDCLSSTEILAGVTKSTFGDRLARAIGIGQHPLGNPLDFFDGLIHEPRVSLRALSPGELLLKKPLICNGRCLAFRGVLEPLTMPRSVMSAVTRAAGSYHPFRLAAASDCTFTMCLGGSTFDASLCLLDEEGNFLDGDNDTCGLNPELVASLGAGSYVLAVSGSGNSFGTYTLSFSCEPSSGGAFIRCDSNCSGAGDLSDSVYTLNFLFLGGPEPCCPAVADCNGDGGLDISDATYGLNFLFLGGPRPPVPFPSCAGSGCPTHPCP